MEEIRKIAFCPHCGNRAPQRLIHSQTCEWIGRSLTDDEELDLPLTYHVASCETCNQVLLYTCLGDQMTNEDFVHGNLEYPDSGNLNISVPESIRKIYEEAARIKMLAPNAFAAQIRKALEALCENRGAKNGVLQKRLADLVSRGELPATFAEATDVLRILGNVGAHASDESVKPSQVSALDEFFRAVVEYVYVAPSKLKAFRDSLSRSKSQNEIAPSDDA